ncbi:FAD-dependent oxidoreductase [Lachnospiraceae bacterium OttesenSCG-928-D06]|nr:FAD-dependent oxidoreductase [Lachnospiraceae bacterium OttesenSCG-928-D06]
MMSLWSDHISLPKFPQLDGDYNTDVLIIGGGLAGLLCAYFLNKKGVNYLLVEGNTICNGVTKDTTAKITSQHGLLYDKLLQKSGREIAWKYLDVNQKALHVYQEMCEKIDCDYEQKNAYVYSVSDRLAIEREVKAIRELGFPADFTEDVKLPFSIAGAVKFPNQAQFHPLKFTAAVAQDLNIREHTVVRKIENGIALTNHGRIKAGSIIVATHFPFLDKHGSYFVKMYQRRSYLLALATNEDVEGMYLEEKKDGISLRNYKEYLLIGGGGHRTGKKGGNWEALREFAKQHYPGKKEAYCFATQDCISLDGIPYIGKYSANTPNLYVTTGFNKWGMSSAMVSAMILSDMVTGSKSDYEDIFSPSRSILHPQLFYNAFESAVNLLSFSKKRCTHLGCALKWNPLEHTWDCPCHGSRFTREGSILENPSTKELS